MANHIITHADPQWVEIAHGDKYVSFAIRDFETRKTQGVVILTAEQAHKIGLDLVQHGGALAVEQVYEAQQKIKEVQA